MTHEDLWMTQQAFVLPKSGPMTFFNTEALKEIANEPGQRAVFAKAILEVIDATEDPAP